MESDLNVNFVREGDWILRWKFLEKFFTFIPELSQKNEKCSVMPKGRGILKDEMVLQLGNGPYLCALPNQHKKHYCEPKNM